LGVDAGKQVIYLSDGNNISSYDFNADVAVTDANGTGKSLSDLVKNSVIELRKNRLIKNAKISQIVIKQVPVNKTADGTIQQLPGDQRIMSFLEATSNQSESYPLADRVTVRLVDGSAGDLTSLHVGDVVTYDVKDSQVVGITLKKQIDIGQTVTGTFAGFNQDKSIINITSANGPSAYFLANSAQVQIDGLDNAGLLDLAPGDQVKLDILNKSVQKITVTNRTIQDLVFNTIVDYNPQTMYLTVKDSNGTPNIYIMTDATGINYMGGSIPLANFASLFGNGKKVDLKVASDKTIKKISLSTSIDATISQVTTGVTTNQITVKAGTNQILTFTVYPGTPVVAPNKPNATLADLKAGDSVTISLSPNQDIVNQISVNKTYMYRVLLTNNATRQITVQDDKGTNYVFTLDASVPIIVNGQSNKTVNDILQDEFIKLTFKGNTIVKAEVANTIRGKVTAVDTASGSLTVQDFNGQTQLIPVGTNFTLKLNGAVAAANLSSVKVNDRVQIMKDADDKLIIQVAAASQRIYSSADTVLNRIMFAATTANDIQSYNMFPRAYFHKGTQLLTLSSFAANDTVMIYVVDDKIIEMEKQ
jgi:hypothetical protein